MRNIFLKLLSFTLFLFMTIQTFADTQSPYLEGALWELPPFENLSKQIRSRPGHFFETEAVKKWLKNSPYNSIKGFILADGHVFNLGPDLRQNSLSWVPTDLDDVGEGPLFLGLAKSLILTQAPFTKNSLKMDTFIDSFMNGIKGYEQAPPTMVEDFLSLSSEQYLYSFLKYGKKQSKHGKIELKEDYFELTSVQLKIIEKVIQENYPDCEFLDALGYNKKTGGSADAERYRILVRFKNSIYDEPVIIDMKEALPSALAIVSDEHTYNELKRLENSIYAIYGNNFETHATDELTPLFKANKIRIYSMKNKLFTLKLKNGFDLDLKNSPKKNSDINNFLEVSNWNFYLQGYWNSSNPQAHLLVEAYEKSPEKFKMELLEMVHNYLAENSI
jgi:hypothetical protein